MLDTLAISPQASGQGYGRSFVKFYEDYAQEHGSRFLRIDTNEKNTNARALYRKLGYNEVGVVPCIFNGLDGIHLVLLEKKIDQ